MSVTVVFVCHDDQSIEHVLPYGFQILLVGNRVIREEYKSKVIMVRDLPHQIEDEPKLLSFTAWYAISKNQLFPDYTHICILEWDVVLDHKFLHQLTEAIPRDAISFIEVDHSFLLDMNIYIADYYLKNKGIEYVFSNRRWGASTNHCISRSLLDKFVDWYFPSCLQIKELDHVKFSWYHERMYMIFLDTQNINYHMVNGLTHLFLNSHKDINS